MRDENRLFFNQEDFKCKIETIMHQQGLDINKLYNILVNDVKYEITKSNLNLYLQRVPNIYFLIALSKALGVSTDYLLNDEIKSEYIEGFDLRFDSVKYTKFINDYYFYFFSTQSNSLQDLKIAKMRIEKINRKYKVLLTIDIENDNQKLYSGDFILSRNYDIGYIRLVSLGFGEIVNIYFIDQIFNSKDPKLITGAMLSISSGDFKRSPVFSRCIISSEKINDKHLNTIKSNLLLNYKYINIDSESIDKSLNMSDLDNTLKQKISTRLKTAFVEKNIHILEESYLMNTIKKDYGLNNNQIMELVNILRFNSLVNVNNKINKSVDARMYNYLKG